MKLRRIFVANLNRICVSFKPIAFGRSRFFCSIFLQLYIAPQMMEYLHQAEQHCISGGFFFLSEGQRQGLVGCQSLSKHSLVLRAEHNDVAGNGSSAINLRDHEFCLTGKDASFATVLFANVFLVYSRRFISACFPMVHHRVIFCAGRMRRQVGLFLTVHRRHHTITVCPACLINLNCVQASTRPSGYPKIGSSKSISQKLRAEKSPG